MGIQVSSICLSSFFLSYYREQRLVHLLTGEKLEQVVEPARFPRTVPGKWTGPFPAAGSDVFNPLGCTEVWRARWR